MEIRQIFSDKKRYLELLLLADEEERMIDRYLERGALYVLGEPARALCVVTDEGGGVAELKNLAVAPQWQRRGLGRRMVEYACAQCGGAFDTLLVGTGDAPGTMAFYQRCGFSYSHREAGFFVKNYSRPIIEDGVRLRDMVYFRRAL
ncbi:GNAT family N-acetyltransferase [Clostridiaceae bacterium]|nr:GNAT family N-acetyltransferase [Clostridiaceae bacterium]NBI83174.1 GNAT family N-acetyltransferase [Clostridiaceae bacterium]RKJ75432.1 GNAT family N-acetyltransferase [Butyricicoccus sp. 1XD8-22]